MEAKQISFEQKLLELEKKVVAQGAATPSSSDSSPHGKKKRKRLVTRELSVSYGCLCIRSLKWHASTDHVDNSSYVQEYYVHWFSH